MKPTIVEDVGDWRERFWAITMSTYPTAPVYPRSTKHLKGGTARKLSRCVEWYGEDWCGISGP